MVLRNICQILMAVIGICYAYHFLYLILPHLKKPRPHKPEVLHKYAVLIAARNEEAVLPHLLDSILDQDYPRELIHVYVVADNCTDGTALAAARKGARVLIREDGARVGKGYALHALLEYIRERGELDSFDAFLVFDADNLLRPDYIRSINRTFCDGYGVFCGYRNSKNFGSNWLTSGYSLVFLHECVHMNRSRMVLGQSAVVTGTGFGFSRDVLEKAGGWNFFTLTEDTQFTYWCAANGIRIGYCHEAMLFDEQPTGFRQSWRQRTRWIQGSIQLAPKAGPGLLRGLFRGGWQSRSCYEFLTLSLWGYGTAAIVSLTNLILVFWTEGCLEGVLTFLESVLGAYPSLFLIGFLTLVTQWKHIHATAGKKLWSLLTFPLFMLSFVPIALAAPLQKFQWKPITHSVAVSARTLAEETQPAAEG